MIRKPLPQITEADLVYLIDNEIAEGPTIDYKRDMPLDNRDTKAEFLADITSFANGAGGDLIIGITEDKGVPTAITGIEVPDADALGLRIENMCRDNVEPRLPTLQTHFVPLASGRHVLILRVGRSWNGPHRNKLDRHFYSRNSRGKYPLDVGELRNAFTLGEVASERIRNFRADRLAGIVAGRTPVPIKTGATIILHLAPIEGFAGDKRLNVDDGTLQLDRFRPLGPSMGYNYRLNLDGHLSFHGSEEKPTVAYTQVFRNGAIESVFIFAPSNDTKILWPRYETFIADGCSKFIPRLAELGFDGPVVAMVSIVNAKDYSLSDSHDDFDARALPHNEIITPDVIVAPGADINQALAPAFGIVWNSFGLARPNEYKAA
jgi:hypothetical protein